MKISKLYFHIHYCNWKDPHSSGNRVRKVARTLQHHAFLFFDKGKGNFTIGKKRYAIQEGRLFYVAPHVFHSLELDPKTPFCCLTVHFSYASVHFNDLQWEIKQETDILPLPSVQEVKDNYQVGDLFKKLVDSWNAKLPGYEFLAKTLLQQLLIALYQNNKRKDRNDSVALKVEKMIQYMHQNVTRKITLAELSEMTQLSPSYLSRMFKDITGYSVIGFFNKIKMDKAKELMMEGNKKVKEVAQALGFVDEFYFSRLFKRMEGISPSEFYSKNVHGL
ncbi:helix-turn-helix domain protein [Anoxybacillus sp. B7M1]|uniref:AraC family transcriptional regulator n=1 Tax=Anoxybacteroides rupiense TaxID=311460 RepID=A0ABD5IXY6_9BACL|nr:MULTISPECIES: AraC family transcriptional regulator [Anoxybacillus]ANB56702.1 helix-turn-helix domain protein [Anoxybacillus sp. B2M1]ANB64958.1 helix-turn-helix domain protein [Anoxybacillus sp. B7M1]KXG09487.1 HTH-type transcriptional activator Btr [Anoxybacillus sp. P3H1B]MBB3908837.1 AraC-like DNA-binding protein [Anoxybacillus rupiensis]MED5052781.1 AraC family transcriptional regulator [Anoxybacillus rupiensis]